LTRFGENRRVTGPWTAPLRGQLDEHTLASEALRGNPLGDPHERPLWVYTPPSYAGGPAVYVLQGFTGQLDMWRNRAPFRATFLELLDDADVDARVVFVDAWTSVGGSQFVDSKGGGRYHTYLCDEIVPFVDARYETSGLRGIAGKSSGGQGAAVTAMLRPDLFQGFASHAGGGLFEVSIRPFFRVAARRLRDAYAGDIHRFLHELRTGPAAFAHPDDIHILLQWGFSAAYSADDNGTIRLPYDVATAEAIPELWERWLDHDYPRLVPRHADALREMRAIYYDVGRRDEWYLDLTAAWVERELGKLAVRDLHVELFDATHLAIEYRYPIGLRYLSERLTR
jgi:pimeloyl-ACP methyl ester carboxylesterase